LLLAACSGGEPTSTAPADPLSAMTLDAGSRWQADEHTRRSVAAMAAAARRVEAQRDPATTAALAEELQQQLEGLFAGCTMQGPAHDALHVYLSALMPRVDEMLDPDPAKATQARDEVVGILARFGDYFA